MPLNSDADAAAASATRKDLTLRALRDATALQHRNLEATPVMAALTDEACDERAIVRALEVLAQGFAELEPALLEETWYRPQGPAIAADLASLRGDRGDRGDRDGRDMTPVTRDASLVEAFACPDAASRLGVAYVLVGSRMGARTIAARLEARFGAPFVQGLAYYGAEPTFAAPQWRALNERLRALDDETHDRQETARADACAAAVRAFDRFTDLARAAS